MESNYAQCTPLPPPIGVGFLTVPVENCSQFTLPFARFVFNPAALGLFSQSIRSRSPKRSVSGIGIDGNSVDGYSPSGCETNCKYPSIPVAYCGRKASMTVSVV